MGDFMIAKYKYLLYAAGVLVLALIVYGTVQHFREAYHIAQANIHQTAADATTNQAVNQDNHVVADTVTMAQHDAVVSARDQQIADLRAKLQKAYAAAHITPDPPPGVPADNHATPVPYPDLSPVETAQKALLAGQDAQHQDDLIRIADRDRLIGSLTVDRDLYKKALGERTAEATQLRAALAISNRPWAVGAGYGTDKTVSIGVERDLGPARIGLDLVRRTMPDGRSTMEGMITGKIRF
jgi:hypothetical protein